MALFGLARPDGAPRRKAPQRLAGAEKFRTCRTNRLQVSH
jgi:hypothetical protein